MARIAWAPLWLATFLYAFGVAIAASRPVVLTTRTLAAGAAALLGYLVTMLVTIHVVPASGAHAALVYAIAMAGGTMAATSIAGLTLPAPFRRQGMMFAVALSLAYPVYVAAVSPAGAPVQVMLALYLAGSALGGLAALARATPAPRLAVA